MSSSSGRWQLPGVHRGDQLVWALKEVLELLEWITRWKQPLSASQSLRSV